MCNFADLTVNTTHTIVGILGNGGIFFDVSQDILLHAELSHMTKISANTYDTLRDYV